MDGPALIIDSPVRALPNASGPEKSVLSSCMSEFHWHGYEFVDRALGQGLKAEDFYVPSHGALWTVFCELKERGEPIELVSLTKLLRDRGILDNMGGAADLTQLHGYAVTSAHFDHHLSILLACSTQRRAIALFTRAIGTLYETEPREAEAKIQQAGRDLAALLDGSTTGAADRSASEVVSEFQAELESRQQGESSTVLETPWDNLNRLLGGGVGVGEITLVGARPSVGKTAFGLNMLQHCAKSVGEPCLMVSIESSTNRLVARMAAGESGVAVSDIGRRKLADREMDAVRAACDSLRGWPFRMRKLHAPSAQDAASVIRRSARQHGLRLVVIDYFQLFRACSSAERSDVRLRMDNALDAICPLASELGVALVLLVQLNRDAESVEAVKLKCSMLKETSRFEQDADCVILLGRGDHEPRGADYEPVTAAVPKNRDGPTSFVRLQRHGPTTTFYQHRG